MTKAKGGHDKWIVIIGSAKLLKGILLLAAAAGLFKLLGKDVAAQISDWIQRLHVDPNNRFFQKIIAKVSGLDAGKLSLVTVGTLFYSGLFLTEGTGLLLRKRWAEYFTVIVTGSFLPLEIYELIKEFNVFKLLVLLANAAIVVYLIVRLRHKEGRKR